MNRAVTRIKEWMKNPWIEFSLVLTLVCIGLFIRAYHFGMIPVGVHQDEAMAAVDAKALADYGTDRFGMKYPVHFTAWIGGQMSVLLSYCMIPFIKLFGFSTISIRMPMLVISAVSLPVIYFMAKRAGGIKLGVTALIIVIICPWHYMQSRWSFDCNAFPHFFLFGACMLAAGVKKHRMLYSSMVFFGLCSYCYGIANYSVPIFLIVMAICLLREKQINLKQLFICVAIYLLVSLPEYLTMLINLLRIDSIETPLFTIPFFEHSFRARDILITNFSWEQLWKNIVCTITTVWFNGDKSVTNTIVRFGPIYYITVLFFVIGLVLVIQKIRRNADIQEKVSYIIMVAWLCMGMWVGIVTKEVTINRINIIFYPILLIAAVGIVGCVEKCKYLVLPIGVMYVVLAAMFGITYFGSWAELSRIYYYEPYINALEYSGTLECDAYYITPDPQGEGVSAVGEILTMYCHGIDAEYYQGISNEQDGVQVLPFTERYHFQDITQEIVDNNMNKSVVYVVSDDALSFFSEELYEISSFYDSYYVISKKP